MGRGTLRRREVKAHDDRGDHRRHEPARDARRLIRRDLRFGQPDAVPSASEEKVNRHNNLIERTFRLEQECAVLEERVRAADRRIDGLEEEQA